MSRHSAAAATAAVLLSLAAVSFFFFFLIRSFVRVLYKELPPPFFLFLISLSSYVVDLQLPSSVQPSSVDTLPNCELTKK